MKLQYYIVPGVHSGEYRTLILYTQYKSRCDVSMSYYVTKPTSTPTSQVGAVSL